jgi:hypothetical protein
VQGATLRQFTGQNARGLLHSAYVPLIAVHEIHC